MSTQVTLKPQAEAAILDFIKLVRAMPEDEVREVVSEAGMWGEYENSPRMFELSSLASQELQRREAQEVGELIDAQCLWCRKFLINPNHPTCSGCGRDHRNW